MSVSFFGIFLIIAALCVVGFGVALIVVLMRAVGGRSSGGMRDSGRPTAGIPPVVDDSLTNPAHPLFASHHAIHGAAPSGYSSDAAPPVDTGNVSSAPMDTGTGSSGADSGGSQCG